MPSQRGLIAITNHSPICLWASILHLYNPFCIYTKSALDQGWQIQRSHTTIYICMFMADNAYQYPLSPHTALESLPTVVQQPPPTNQGRHQSRNTACFLETMARVFSFSLHHFPPFLYSLSRQPDMHLTTELEH